MFILIFVFVVVVVVVVLAYKCSCFSEVGRTGDKQYISIVPHCWKAGDVAHEIGERVNSASRCFLSCSTGLLSF